jgi:hypothetical protein
MHVQAASLDNRAACEGLSPQLPLACRYPVALSGVF